MLTDALAINDKKKPNGLGMFTAPYVILYRDHARDDSGERVGVLHRVLGQEPSDVALERLRARPLNEVDLERRQELGELRHRRLRRAWQARHDSPSLQLHPTYYNPNSTSTKQY